MAVDGEYLYYFCCCFFILKKKKNRKQIIIVVVIYKKGFVSYYLKLISKIHFRSLIFYSYFFSSFIFRQIYNIINVCLCGGGGGFYMLAMKSIRVIASVLLFLLLLYVRCFEVVRVNVMYNNNNKNYIKRRLIINLFLK